MTRGRRRRRGVRRLFRHHVPLAVITIGGTGVLASAIGSWSAVRPWSLATAYVGLALLSATLILGPVTVLTRRRWPVSSDLRRDVGIWAALAGTAHVVLGLQVHLGGHIISYFKAPPGAARAELLLRSDMFGVANYVGLAAVTILLLLLSLSSDLALRALGARRWKRLHRLAYALFGLVILHGVLYLILEHREYPLLGLLLAVAGVVAAAQLAGFMRRRAMRRYGGMVTR